MSDAFVICLACKKPNNAEGRYCIGCGSILSPVYCSSCGTANPDGVNQCLECGGSIPTMKGMHFSPIVNVLEPTSAMIEGNPFAAPEAGQNPETENSRKEKRPFSRLRSILNRK